MSIISGEEELETTEWEEPQQGKREKGEGWEAGGERWAGMCLRKGCRSEPASSP